MWNWGISCHSVHPSVACSLIYAELFDGDMNTELRNVDDRTINEYGADGGMIIRRANLPG
jgi:hypothetical protein